MRRSPLGLRRWCVVAGATLKARRVAPHHSAPDPTPATQRRIAKRFAGRFAQKRKNASERNTKRPESRHLSKGCGAKAQAPDPLRRRHDPWPGPGRMRRRFVFSSRQDCSRPARAGRTPPIPLGPKLAAINQNSRAHREKPGRATRPTPPGAPHGHNSPPHFAIAESKSCRRPATTKRNAPIQRRRRAGLKRGQRRRRRRARRF